MTYVKNAMPYVLMACLMLGVMLLQMYLSDSMFGD